MSTPVLPPTRSTLPGVDIRTFFSAVNQAMSLHLHSHGPPEATAAPIFVHSFPKERLSAVDAAFNVITFRVLSSKLAPFSRSGEVVQVAPKIYQKKPHPEKMGYSIVVIGWKEMAEVEFKIWSRSNDEADELTLWFHKFLTKYNFAVQYFKARGIDYFKFLQRGEDTVDQIEGQEIYTRVLRYQIRYEINDAFEVRNLDSVTINVSQTDGGEIDTIEVPAS